MLQIYDTLCLMSLGVQQIQFSFWFCGFKYFVSAKTSGDCNQWLLNPLWKIAPSIAFVEGKGVQFITNKDHN